MEKKTTLEAVEVNPKTFHIVVTQKTRKQHKAKIFALAVFASLFIYFITFPYHSSFLKWSKCSTRKLLNEFSTSDSKDTYALSHSGDRVALVSLCKGGQPIDSSLCTASFHNHIHYSRIHAMVLRGNYVDILHEIAFPFTKIDRIFDVISSDDVEWVFYLDFNIFFVDFSASPTQFIDSDQSHLLVHWDPTGTFIQAFLLRASRWSLHFLQLLQQKMEDMVFAENLSHDDYQFLDSLAFSQLLKEQPLFFRQKLSFLPDCMVSSYDLPKNGEKIVGNSSLVGYSYRFPRKSSHLQLNEETLRGFEKKIENQLEIHVYDQDG